MDSSLRWLLLSCIAVYFVIIAVMLKRRALGLRYTLLWIICGAGMLLVAVFPEIVFRASAWVGISNPVNAIFFLFGMFTMTMLLSLTSIVSRMSERSLRLAQSVALLEERIHRMEVERRGENQ